MTEMYAFVHSSLGRLQGIRSEGGIAEFRGIPFATIKHRWANPVLRRGRLSNSEKTEFDASKYGPLCPQPADALQSDFSLYGDISLPAEAFSESETECLNANLFVPAGDVERPSKLPVIVFIHGGGLVMGGCSWPQYNLARFISLAASLGKPIIGVSFNYRLGALGFLASSELGLTGNYGFIDQACAFRWVHENITGFGGDAGNITAVGESAGAISIHTHMTTSQDALFHRAIIMSGDVSLRRPRTIGWWDRNFALCSEHLGDAFPKEERVNLFKTMHPDRLSQTLPYLASCNAAVGGSFLPQSINVTDLSDPKSELGKPSWCREIVLGDTAHDGTILRRLAHDAAKVIAAIDEVLPSDGSTKLKAAYCITPQDNEASQRAGAEMLLGELCFYLPVMEISRAWNLSSDRVCHEYHLHQANNFSGNFTGLASHELDVAILLQNFNKHMSANDTGFAQAMAEVWIDFVCGNGWPAKSKLGEILKLGPDCKLEVQTGQMYELACRGGRGGILRHIGWEDCLKIREIVQGIWSED